MAETKKYFWLKLKEDFFDDKITKYLRQLPDGNALVIIYLKMQLKSLKTEGFIKYDGLLPTCEEELALILDENVNLVKLTISALERVGVVERWDNDTLYISSLQPLIGKETAVAERVRKHRAKKAELSSPKSVPMLQCNTNETNCNTEIEIEIEKELEIEKEIELEIEKEIEIEKIDYSRIINLYNDICISFPRLRSLSDNRKKAIKARLNSGYTYEDFEAVFEEAENSSFLKGKNDRDWSATFDWMIKDSSMAKILEGNYRDKGYKPAEETDNPFLKIAMEMGEND